MKVAVIIERFDVSLGGAERSVSELASGLRGRGVDVRLLAASGSSRVKYVRYVCRSGVRRVSFGEFYRGLREHIAAENYDIIHSTLPFDFADVYQPRGGSYKETINRSAVSCRSGIAFYWKTLTHWTNRRRRQWLTAERRLCEPGGKPIIAALSSYVRQQFIQHYGVDERRVTVIPNGVKIRTDSCPEARDALRHNVLLKLGLKEADEPVFFLFAANNFRLKGLACAIEALGFLEKTNPGNKAYLLIAGSGKIGRYQRLTSRLGVSEKVVFLGGLKDVQPAIYAADVNILPTFYDPASRIIIESLAAGMPVITTSFNGAVDLFEHNRHGTVIESPEQIEALAGAIDKYLDRQSREAAKQAIIDDNLPQQLSLNRHIDQLLKLYEQIIANREPPELEDHQGKNLK